MWSVTNVMSGKCIELANLGREKKIEEEDKNSVPN